MKRLVNVYRGQQLESFHTGSIAIVGSGGRLLAFAGDPSESTFLRSAAKPFQTLPLLQEGGLEEFDLTEEEIALSSGSHGGEPRHVTTVAAMLRKGDFDESDLLCGIHPPYDEKTAIELKAAGETPSVLHNNCSGKHAGMLLATQLMDAPSARYVEATHPLQDQIKRTLAEFTMLPADQILTSVDGCGVPSFFLSLYRAALAYARLIETADVPESPSALERYRESARAIVDAMTGCPAHVGGAWTMTTPLMESFDGDLLAKEGAEGFYAMAPRGELADQIRERLRAEESGSIGIVLKVHDGSMTRGRNPVILRTLELLGIKLEHVPLLKKFRDPQIRNYSGTLVGEVRAEFELEVL